MPFWHGIREPESTEIDEYLKMMGKSSANVFPLKYACAIKIDSKNIEGTLEGFYYLQQEKELAFTEEEIQGKV